MNRPYTLFKSYSAFLGLLGLSFAQILNFRPSSQLPFYFIVFCFLVILTVINCLQMLRGRKLAGRSRLAAGGALALAVSVSLFLGYVYYIPDIFPIHIQAGAESRVTNPRLKALHGVSLDWGLRDDKVGSLFPPDHRYFSISPAVHRITIDNRSTVHSPPLKLRVTLRTPKGRAFPPVVFAAAVTSDAVRGWHPFGNMLTLIISRLHPEQSSTDTSENWLSYEGWYSDALAARHKGEEWWSFILPPATITSWTEWREPEFWLPSIPSRSSLEIYLELAFRDQATAEAIPAIVELREGTKGEFAVDLRKHVDLNAGSDRR